MAKLLTQQQSAVLFHPTHSSSLYWVLTGKYGVLSVPVVVFFLPASSEMTWGVLKYSVILRLLLFLAWIIMPLKKDLGVYQENNISQKLLTT